MRIRIIIATVIGLAAIWTASPSVAIAAPGISVDPESRDFGLVPVSTPSGPQGFVVSNTGDANLDVSSVSLTGNDPGEFEIHEDGCSGQTVTPGHACAILVYYKPTAMGPADAKLTISSNAPGSQSPANFGLSGTGRWYYSFQFDPAYTDFGQQAINKGPTASKTIEVTSAAFGATPMTITGLTINAQNSADFAVTDQNCLGATLQPGESCHVSIDFQPGAVGPRTANMRISTDDLVAISTLTGDGVDPGYTLTPGSVDFGTLSVGTFSESSQFTLTSTGTTDLEVGTASLTGSAASQFNIGPDVCSNLTLAPNTSCQVGVWFMPDSAGEKTASLSVPMNAGLSSSSQLTGSGQNPVPPPNPCEPVAVKKIHNFTPEFRKPSDVPGVRARITTAGPAVMKVSSEVIVHGPGSVGVIQYGQQRFKVSKKKFVNYKVAIPKRFRGEVELGKKVRFVIHYASKSTSPECTKFGEGKTRNLTTRIVNVTPNG